MDPKITIRHFFWDTLYNIHFLIWALVLWDHWTIVFDKVLKSPALYKQAMMLSFVESNRSEYSVNTKGRLKKM